jgi:hypothetical protein
MPTDRYPFSKQTQKTAVALAGLFFLLSAISIYVITEEISSGRLLAKTQLLMATAKSGAQVVISPVVDSAARGKEVVDQSAEVAVSRNVAAVGLIYNESKTSLGTKVNPLVANADQGYQVVRGGAGQLVDKIAYYWQRLVVAVWEYKKLVVHNWRQFLSGEKPNRQTVVISTTTTTTTTTVPNLTELKSEIKQELSAEMKREINLAVEKGIKNSGGSSAGLVVLPSTGSAEADALVMNHVKSVFSDEVKVRFDATNRSGVLTPVFRGAAGDNYLFLLTPLAR